MNKAIFIWIILLLELVFFSCKTDDSDDITPDIDPQSQIDFYGIWLCPASESGLIFDITIEISSDKLHYVTTRGMDFTVYPLEWEPAENNKITTKDEYPNGYLLSGARSDGLAYKVPYYIHANKKKLSQNGYKTIFNKQ
jgi:hypothetical protein